MIPTTFFGRYVQMITPYWLIQLAVWMLGMGVRNWIIWWAVAIIVHTISFHVAQREQKEQQRIYEKEKSGI